MEDDDPDFEDVERLLDADLSDFDHELDRLYGEIERYAEVASALDSAGRGDDAEYFRELAVESYQSFSTVIQLKKDGDDYKF